MSGFPLKKPLFTLESTSRPFVEPVVFASSSTVVKAVADIFAFARASLTAGLGAASGPLKSQPANEHTQRGSTMNLVLSDHPAAEWQEVTPRTACRQCGKGSWCARSEAGWEMCMRVPGGIERVNKNGEVYWLTAPHGSNAAASPPEFQPAPGAPLADPDDLNLVYKLVLDKLCLSQEHRQALQKRGFTDEQMESIGFRSFGPKDLPGLAKTVAETFPDVWQRVPGLYLKDGRPALCITFGLLIPCRDARSKIVGLRVRLDDQTEGSRYRWVSSKNHNGPSCGALASVWRPESAPDLTTIRLTEGECKAGVAADLTGIITVCAPGIGQFTSPLVRSIIAQLTAELTQHSQVDVCLLLAPDSDAMTNPQVHLAVLRALECYPAAKVEVWPVEHKGIDDALVVGADVRAVSSAEYRERLIASERTEVVALGQAQHLLEHALVH